jgi:hypothetical protein
LVELCRNVSRHRTAGRVLRWLHRGVH